jgi:DNA-binding NtrC family response regulator
MDPCGTMDLARAMPKHAEAVLLVDSRPTGLRLLQAVLEPHLEVTIVARPDEALALLERRRFDGLVASAADVDLDEGGFLERASALCAGVGRIVVGSEDQADGVLRALRRGQATAFVLEPFTPDELLVALRRALRTEPPRALLVLADREVRLRVKGLLERGGVECWDAASAADVLARLDAQKLDGVVVGLDLGAGEALALLGQMRSRYPRVRPVVLGDDDLPALAADLRRLGVYDYLAPGLPDRQLLFRIRAALEDRPWADVVDEPPLRMASASADADAGAIVGGSRVTEGLRALVAHVAGRVGPVVIRGEPGSGKSLVARRLHALGPRPQAPFLTVDCVALPEGMFEAELFGQERSATAAGKPGACELAGEGTIYLDEAGELPAASRARLVRLLRSGELARAGGRTVIACQARVLLGTSGAGLDLLAAGEALEVKIPPLRERLDDLPELVAHLLARLCREHGRPTTRLAPRPFERLLAHPWPGNVRELESALERALLLATGTVIDEVRLGTGTTGVQQPLAQAASIDQPLREAVEAATRQVEREYLVRVLTVAAGNVIQASRRAGIDRRNFYRKLSEHGLDPADFRRPTGTFTVVR